MTILMELRCEKRGEGRNEDNNRCWSDDNDGPHSHGRDSKKGAADCYAEIAKQTTDSGWVKRKEGWVCPNCLKHQADFTVEGDDNG